MNGFTFNPQRGMWHSPVDGGIWYDPGTGEFFSERFQVWTVVGRWPQPVASQGIKTPEAPKQPAAPAAAANAGGWAADDPVPGVLERIFELPRIDRQRLLRIIVLELDEPDDKASFEEFADRVSRYGVDLRDRDAVYQLYTDRPASYGRRSSSEAGGLEQTVRRLMGMPADGTKPRPYLRGGRR